MTRSRKAGVNGQENDTTYDDALGDIPWLPREQDFVKDTIP